MDPYDVVFTSTIPERDLTITLYEGTPSTFGRQHIIHERQFMENKMHAVKYAVENADICYWDEDHGEGNREKIYCLGADNERPHMYMKVVVAYDNSKEGTIITAWPEKGISPSEGEITYVKSKK